MGSLIPQPTATKLVPRPQPVPLATPRQLDLVLDDARLHDLTGEQRQAILEALAKFLLVATGATQEAGDDDA